MSLPDLPEGTVTLVLTDVEGSTGALRRLGERYAASLALHREIVRTATSRHDGFEVDTQGDSFLLVFARAEDALDAVTEITTRLEAVKWPEGVPLHARIGVHTGAVERVPHGYVGIELHRAARISACAHGGQVVVSASTRALAPARAFIDLGHHHLKDLDEPERLFQLARPDGRVFQPLRARARRALPTVGGRFVNRLTEREELDRLLAERARVITLTGPGGAGKSRLALEVAHAWVDRTPHGVHLARLASVDEAEDVPAELANAIGIPPGDDAAGEVIAYLADRTTVVIVDNLEHVQEGARPFLVRLVEEAPGVTLLVTSRSPLRIRGEHVIDVGPLEEGHALELFADRARSADGRFQLDESTEAAVRRVCRRVDGLPLAIEIVAARVRSVAVRDLAEGEGFDLRTEGAAEAPDRQRTLAATIAWGTGLLDERLQELHARLGVFQGRFTPEAARVAFGATFDDLDALVGAALLRRVSDDDGPTRMAMLQTVRDYARGRLRADGTMDEALARRAAWIEELAARAAQAFDEDDSAGWLTELAHWLPDIRATLREAATAGDHARSIRITSALERFWRACGDVAEPRSILREALAAAPPGDDEARAQALWTLSRFALAQGDPAGAREPLVEALELYRRTGLVQETAFALTDLSWIALALGELDAAATAAEEAHELAAAVGSPRATSFALTARATVAAEQGDPGAARRFAEESLAIRRALGDRLLVANAALTLGTAALAEGDLTRAEAALDECLALAIAIGDVLHEAGARCCLGEIAALRGEPSRASEELLPALAAFLRIGNGAAAAECLVALAAVESDDQRALRLVEAAKATRSATGVTPLPVERELEARVRARCDAGVTPSGPPLSLVDAALLAGVDPTRI